MKRSKTRVISRTKNLPPAVVPDPSDPDALDFCSAPGVLPDPEPDPDNIEQAPLQRETVEELRRWLPTVKKTTVIISLNGEKKVAPLTAEQKSELLNLFAPAFPLIAEMTKRKVVSHYKITINPKLSTSSSKKE